MDKSRPQKPVNPYGVTKFVAERAMRDFGRAYGLQTVALRYFNAAGCDPEGELGERHERGDPSHTPCVLREALRVRAGGRPEDTGIARERRRLRHTGRYLRAGLRARVEILRLAASLLALQCLVQGQAERFEAYNLGNQRGISVKEVIAVCREVTGIDIRYVAWAAAAPGDPPALVADSRRAREVLGWAPRYENLTDIVRTAWNWFAEKAPA